MAIPHLELNFQHEIKFNGGESSVGCDAVEKMSAEFKKLQIKRYPKLASKPKGDVEYWKKFNVSQNYVVH